MQCTNKLMQVTAVVTSEYSLRRQPCQSTGLQRWKLCLIYSYWWPDKPPTSTPSQASIPLSPVWFNLIWSKHFQIPINFVGPYHQAKHYLGNFWQILDIDFGLDHSYCQSMKFHVFGNLSITSALLESWWPTELNLSLLWDWNLHNLCWWSTDQSGAYNTVHWPITRLGQYRSEAVPDPVLCLTDSNCSM